MTDTQESFDTAPELSEPTEQFFRSLLKQEPEPEINIQTIKMSSSIIPDNRMKVENLDQPN
jgi:inhibitor of KinA sporulation pathway (predicted exonuclease)